MSASVEDHEVWKQIDASAYLLLSELTEPRDNSLKVVLEEAVANQAKAGKRIFAGGVDFGEAVPVEPTSSCRIFILEWKSYVAYCVTEEMVGSCGNYEDEIYTGKLIRIYKKSHFLDFIAKDTGAHLKPYRHYKIACQNHVVDVVSSIDPQLEVISRGDTAPFKN